MNHETNPFRISMYARSQSPVDEADIPQSVLPSAQNSYGTRTTDSTRVNQEGRDSVYSVLSTNSQNSTTSPSSQNSYTPHNRKASDQRPRNPFRVELSEAPLTSSSSEPPPYEEGGKVLESGPAATNDEKPRSADENYRRGIEEGIRLAKEKERQKRRERRRIMESRSHRHSKEGQERDSKDKSKYRTRPSVHRSSSAGDTTRHSSSRSRSKSDSASRKKPESLDVIDKMDVTGIYGSSRFHHDGPFDACAPHRNKQGIRGATPMSAFPVDGPNNSLAVEDPALASYRTAESVYGRAAENVPPEVAQSSFDPLDRGAKLHGERTRGLGSTTFIDGTPASRDAIEESYTKRTQNLGRSRSLFRPKQSEDPNGGEQKSSLLNRVRSLRVSRH